MFIPDKSWISRLTHQLEGLAMKTAINAGLGSRPARTGTPGGPTRSLADLRAAPLGALGRRARELTRAIDELARRIAHSGG